VDILEPREGIGGHCLPKDTKMLIQSSSNSTKSKILTAAMEVDQDYRSYKQSKENKIEEVFGQLQQQQQQQQQVQNPLSVSTI
jgi:UDP-glucose 6-dehydrogenase